MLEELNFVKGAVSTKDLVPVLTHFRFADGRVQGGNGRIYMDAPCDLGGKEIIVPADRFIQAIDASSGDARLNVTKGGKLTITSGSFRAILPLSQDEFPVAKPEGRSIKAGDLVATLVTLRPFIGTDATRPWACGVLMKDGFAYATNNVIMVRMPIEWKGPAINLPAFAVDELVRINEVSTKVFIAENSVTFEFGDRWMKTQLFDVAWPDVDKFFTKKQLKPVPEGLLEAVDKVIPFCPDSKFPEIRLGKDGVSTADGEMCAQVSGIELPEGRYRAEPLTLTLEYATHIDLANYPKPCQFSGDDGLQGVIIGLRS